tara:strand:- start:1235 stop:2122 length:888 start_codon:yes stop_codon:yes gene_type:complete
MKNSSKYIYFLIITLIIFNVIQFEYNKRRQRKVEAFIIPEKKTLITYVFFENKETIKNLNFFIKNGVFNNNNVQYNFIIKGNKCSVKFPDYKNIKVYKMKNEGYDFGGYSYSIQMINKNTFDYYIFLNDTVIGPFVPRFNSKNMWYENFISLISDKVKLVGPTINRKQYNNIPEHVQSMAFGTDNIGLELLIKNNIFNLENNIKIYETKGKAEFIMNFEIGMSGVILKNGYEISSFMQSDNYYKNLEHGDIHFTNKYFDITLNPVEIMFIKNNRINDLVTKRYISWNSLKDNDYN